LKTKNNIASRNERGFSLVELTVVILISFILMAMAVLSIRGALPGMRADAAMNRVMGQLRTGRELSLAQRRFIRLQFIGNNQVRLQRIEVGGAIQAAPLDVVLENNVQFMQFPGLPDTPDAFGNNTAVDFGGTPTTLWNSDGTFVDTKGLPLNGTVFLAIPGQPSSARAVTILGSTGRVRAYRWNGRAWAD